MGGVFFEHIILRLSPIVSNNSDDYEILQELDGHVILLKFFQDFDQNYFQELDDHRILMKFFKAFDQNPDGQP